MIAGAVWMCRKHNRAIAEGSECYWCLQEENEALRSMVRRLEGARVLAAAESVENYKRATRFREALERICDLVADTNTLGDAIDIANTATARKN